MALFKSGENYTEAVTEVPIIDRSADTTPNDSDKTFTVPQGEMLHLNSVMVILTTTATVGNRQILLEAKNTAGVVVGRISAGAVQAASLTRHYMCMQGTYRETAFINGDIQIPIPTDSFLPAGFSLHVFDSAAIDPAADDMTVSISVKKYKGF
jgi:hypothetical protein